MRQKNCRPKHFFSCSGRQPYSVKVSRTISRVMSWMVIYLILLLPAGFSDLPKNVTGSHIVFCSVLLRMGFTCALSVTRQAVVSYTAFPPLPGEPGGLFLLHWPWSHLHRTLSGILPFEARTFLTWPLSVLSAATIYSTYRISLPQEKLFVKYIFYCIIYIVWYNTKYKEVFSWS